MKINKLDNTTKKTLKVAAATATFVLPAAYMTKRHVDMYDKNDKLNRQKMFNKMIGFLGGVGASILLIHSKTAQKDTLMHAGKILLAAVLPFVGLFGAKAINKNLGQD